MKLQLTHTLKKLLAAWDRFRAPANAPALSNELGGLFDQGRETLQIDPSTVLPVSSKYLVYQRGSSQYYAAVAGGAGLPLGVSPDAPYQAGDFLDIERFGATRGTQLGYSAGTITIDDLVYAAASGLVGDLATAGHGTFWVIGRATKTVAASGLEITFIPCFPYQVTQ
ncbi:MAG: hypothetical protein ABSG59_10125 [Verrucomicrobiota bacterium]|jgi:hypothetical protein